MLQTTLFTIQKAYDDGCRQTITKDEPCIKKFLSDVYAEEHKVLLLNETSRYSSYFDSDFLYSDETILERIVAPAKHAMQRIYSETYFNCDFKVIQGLPPIKKSTSYVDEKLSKQLNGVDNNNETKQE